MKRIFLYIVLLLLAASSFAQEEKVNTADKRGKTISNKFIFIEGSADKTEYFEFFMTNFTMEAVGAGYTVTGKKSDAAHTLKFSVSANTDDKTQVSPDDNQYIIKISLMRNSDDLEVIVFDFFFSDLEEMFMYNRTLFQNATFNIPPFNEEELILERELNSRWKNKWIYIRASFDYPITFYILQGTGLISGIGLYYGDYEKPIRVSPISHEITALPGATLGLEVQFLNFMSLEVNYQFTMGDTRSNTFINMISSVELKFPIKFEHIILAPFAASSFFLNNSPVFQEYPLFAVGGGFQFCVKGGKRGAFFVDAKYMLSFSEAVMHNPYLVYPEANRLYPKPEVIHYNRSAIGIGIGYKVGFFDRIKK